MKQIILSISAAALLMVVTGCSKDPFENSIYSEQPAIGVYQNYIAQSPGLPSGGTEPILKTGSDKSIIKKGKLLFKDSDGDGKLDPYEDWRLPPRERAADLAAQMPSDKKVGLFNWLGESGNTMMTKDDKGTEDQADDIYYYGLLGLSADGSIEEKVDMGRGPVNSLPFSLVENGTRYINDQLELDPLDEIKYNNNLQGLAERTTWGIPVIISSDPLHSAFNGDDLSASRISKWPFYLGLGAADDLSTTKRFGEIAAEEMRMQGHHMMLGPQADIAAEPRWGRIQHLIHAYGDTTAKHMKILIKAMQGGNALSPDGIAAAVKHFPGSGSVEEGMDSHSAPGRYSVFPGNNFEEHLIPFQAAIDAGAAAIMSCYSIMDIEKYKDMEKGEPVDEGAAFSKTIMTDLLKTEMGFDGSVVSDWSIATHAAWGHMSIQEKPELFAEMFNAGTYQYGGQDYTEKWREALDLELITEEKVNEAAIRSLELQFRLGLFENPYVDLNEAAAYWDPEGEALKVRMAEGEKAMKKAMVLTENNEINSEQSLLPVLGTDDSYIASVDRNGNGVVDVFFDSAYPDADSGQEKSKAFSTDDQYLNINFVEDASKADILIARVFSRGATYFGTQGGTPLSYDAPVMVWDHEKQAYTDEAVPVNSEMSQGYPELKTWKFNDWSYVGGSAGNIGQGFQTYLGAGESKAIIERTLAAQKANPGLKVIIGMTASRPGIVTSFYDKVDGMIIDFAATDKAFLDIIFWQNGDKPEGRLPVEFPRDDASVAAQFEDVPGDTANPVYEIGYGLSYASTGGYGYGG